MRLITVTQIATDESFLVEVTENNLTVEALKVAIETRCIFIMCVLTITRRNQDGPTIVALERTRTSARSVANNLR